MIAFSVTVYGKPVSKNAGQRVNKFGKPYVTAEAREFQVRVRAAVRAAAEHLGWPEDPFMVDHARYSIYKYNMPTVDHDAGSTYISDALQYQRMRTKAIKEADFWGLIWNDRVLSLGESPRPINDGGEIRIEIRFELLALCSPLIAAERRRSWEIQEERRKERRRNKARAKRKEKANNG